MHPLATQLQALGIMAAHESAMADLYEVFAGQFPQHKAFFRDLAEQEREHARAVSRFADKVQRGSAHVALERFSAKELLVSLDEVHGLQDQTRAGQLTLIQALYAAAELEESLLDGRRFEIIEHDGPELRQLLADLNADTANHRRQVRLALERETGGPRGAD